MPVRSFTTWFDPDTVAILVRAYDAAIQDLGLPPQPPADETASPHHKVAQSIMDLALQGERRFELLKAAGVSALRSSAA